MLRIISKWDIRAVKGSKFDVLRRFYSIGMTLAEPSKIQTIDMSKAWLIGVYTTEMDSRIEELGYTVSHVFSTPEIIDSFSSPPDMIVFTDDGHSDLTAMETLRHVFPEVLIISIPLSNSFLESCVSYTDRRAGEQSVARLLNQIHEREHRWDN